MTRQLEMNTFRTFIAISHQGPAHIRILPQMTRPHGFKARVFLYHPCSCDSFHCIRYYMWEYPANRNDKGSENPNVTASQEQTQHNINATMIDNRIVNKLLHSQLRSTFQQVRK